MHSRRNVWKTEINSEQKGPQTSSIQLEMHIPFLNSHSVKSYKPYDWKYFMTYSVFLGL